MRVLLKFRRTYWTELEYVGDYTSDKSLQRMKEGDGELMSSLCEARPSGIQAHAPVFDTDYPVVTDERDDYTLVNFTRAAICPSLWKGLFKELVVTGIMKRRDVPKLSRLAQPRPDGKVKLPVLKISAPVHVVESKTKGHHHVIIDALMPFDKYCSLLRRLEEARIIDPEFCRLSVSNGMSLIARPRVKSCAKLCNGYLGCSEYLRVFCRRPLGHTGSCSSSRVK